MFNKKFDCMAWAVLLMGAGASGMCPAQGKPKEQGKQSILIASNGLTTVLPASEGKSFFPKGTQYWTPAPVDIAHLEEDLPKLAKASPMPRPHGGSTSRSILAYCRQYIGVIQGGRRCIYINALHPSVASESGDWHKQAMRYDDGGDLFYQVTYDVKNREFEKFAYNGYA